MAVLDASICDACVRECIRVLDEKVRAELHEALERLPTSCVLCSTPLAEDDVIVLPIGRNASGKTTLLRHIVGLQLPTRGQARTLGVAPGAGVVQRPHLGRMVLSRPPSCFRWLSGGPALRWADARQTGPECSSTGSS